MPEFENNCNNSDIRWKCQSCKQKLCVSCNLSTYNKPKTSCCLCGNLYHNVCIGLPKSEKNYTDWLCHSCRPFVFPFHNVDHKNLVKLSTYVNKFSLKNMSLLAMNMSRTCSICASVLSLSLIHISEPTRPY